MDISQHILVNQNSKITNKVTLQQQNLYPTHYFRTRNPESLRSFFAIPFVVELKSRHRKRPGDPSRIGERDLTRTGIVDVDVGNGDPDEELLGLDPGELLHAAVLDKGRDLVVVRDVSADGAEPVLLLALLLEPHEPGGAVVADLDDVG